MRHESTYRPLGASGLMVSPLGAGTNQWVQGKNDEAVFQAYQALVDAGVNLFDTAEVYNRGKSERLLGACLQRDGRPVVIASKFAPSSTRLSPQQFMNALDASLSRLGIQTVDLYYVHFPSPVLSIEALMDLMAQAVEAGKVRAVGVSNFTAEQMRQAATRLARYQIPLAANEVHYNVWHRQPEEDGVLDACRELNVALVAYRPLEGGLLASDPVPASNAGILQETLQTIAQQCSKSVSQVALNWLLRRDEWVIPIPGVTSARHAQENADTLRWELSENEFAAIEQASSTGKP